MTHDDLAQLIHVDASAGTISTDPALAALALSPAEAVTLAAVLAEAAKAVTDPL